MLARFLMSVWTLPDPSTPLDPMRSFIYIGTLFAPSDHSGCLGINYISWDPSYFQSLWTPLDPLVALWNYWVPLHPLDPSIFIALDPISSIKVLLDPSLPFRTLLNQLGPLWIP